MKAQMPPLFCPSAPVCSASVVLREDAGAYISTTRPRGRPPTPSAMSSPSEPEEIVSMSIERSFLPSRITEPLPNWRSIWESAADRALVLSMEDPSTIRRAVADIGRAPYGGDSLAGQTGGDNDRNRWLREQCTLFVPRSQYVLFVKCGGSQTRSQVAPFQSVSGPLG